MMSPTVLLGVAGLMVAVIVAVCFGYRSAVAKRDTRFSRFWKGGNSHD
jgi:ABC-type dipeptide/oligopeptide/nickel transport system permease component